MKLITNYIHGKITESLSSKTSPVFNPSTGEKIAEVVNSNNDDLIKVIESSKKPQKRFTIQAYLEFTNEPNLKWTSNGYPNLINKLKNKLKPRNPHENSS